MAQHKRQQRPEAPMHEDAMHESNQPPADALHALTAEDLDIIAPMGVPLAEGEDVRIASATTDAERAPSAHADDERTVRGRPKTLRLATDTPDAPAPPRRDTVTLRSVPPPETPSMRRTREAIELAGRIRTDEDRHGPAMLAMIARSYRALASQILRGGEIPTTLVSRVGDRRTQLTKALAEHDTAAAARLLAEDIEFKDVYARALDIIKRGRERNPSLDTTRKEWEGLSLPALAKEQDKYERGVAKHQAGKPFKAAEVSRAYGMREEYQRARDSAARARKKGDEQTAERYDLLASKVLDDDLWYKQAAREHIAHIIRDRGTEGEAAQAA